MADRSRLQDAPSPRHPDQGQDMRRRGWIRYLPLAILGVMIVIFAAGLRLSGQGGAPSALIGVRAPDFSLPSLYPDHPDVSSEGLSDGVPTIVNVWASWCVPCRAEHPALQALSTQGIRVIGLNFRDKRKAARAFLDALGDPFDEVAFDGKGRVSIDWGVVGVPETFVVDGSGVIRYKHAGPIQNDDLETIILPQWRSAQRWGAQ